MVSVGDCIIIRCKANGAVVQLSGIVVALSIDDFTLAIPSNAQIKSVATRVVARDTSGADLPIWLLRAVDSQVVETGVSLKRTWSGKPLDVGAVQKMLAEESLIVAESHDDEATVKGVGREKPPTWMGRQRMRRSPPTTKKGTSPLERR